MQILYMDTWKKIEKKKVIYDMKMSNVKNQINLLNISEFRNWPSENKLRNVKTNPMPLLKKLVKVRFSHGHLGMIIKPILKLRNYFVNF